MKLFASTLNQMGVLGLYMAIGFIIAKLKIIPKETSKILSKLENSVFLPALVLYTFLANFTVAALRESWLPLLVKTYIADIPFAVYASLICSLSMPLGLNTVVIPAAYGKDTSIPAGMALISHLLSIATIPLIMLIFI